MIRFEFLSDAGVLIVAPKGALSAEDFREISRRIDPYIREKGKLTGPVCEARRTGPIFMTASRPLTLPVHVHPFTRI